MNAELYMYCRNIFRSIDSLLRRHWYGQWNLSLGLVTVYTYGKNTYNEKNSACGGSYFVLCISLLLQYYMCLANYGASEAVNLDSMYVEKSNKYSEQKCASYFRE
jgi:hypothetical protein